ncbi:TIGR03364 family FAD-dependent oxidoreductase [Chitinimonas naiadis]
MNKPRLAIVGAGIVGLAHALAAAKRGYAVTVFERDAEAIGASVRNFGLGLSLGQPEGEMLTLAQRTRELWLDLLPATDSWYKAQGSLTVARNAAEMAVLEAFQSEHGAAYATRLLSAARVAEHHAIGLGGLYSPSEIALEARRVIPALAKWLAKAYDVVFHYGTQVNAIELPQIHTSRGVYPAERAIVCSGHDFQTLYPEAYAPLGLRRCALQMLRVANPGIHLGPALMTGLSTLHYASFTQSPALTAPLTALREQVLRNRPAVLEHGVHLIVQQVGESGELIIGDSHHYGETVSPFKPAEIEDLLLGLAEGLLNRPLQVLERWQGVYASGPRAYEVQQAAEGVQAVTITAGVGMSIALGLAERVMGH